MSDHSVYFIIHHSYSRHMRTSRGTVFGGTSSLFYSSQNYFIVRQKLFGTQRKTGCLATARYVFRLVLLIADVLGLSGVKGKVADSCNKAVDTAGKHRKEDVCACSGCKSFGLKRCVVDDKASYPAKEECEQKAHEIVVVFHFTMSPFQIVTRYGVESIILLLFIIVNTLLKICVTLCKVHKLGGAFLNKLFKENLNNGHDAIGFNSGNLEEHRVFGF